MIDILYQDDYIVIANKPESLAVHKNKFMPKDAPYLTKIVGDQLGKWVLNVHRLDSQTSGIIVLALTKEAATHIGKQFENRTVKKQYTAIVQGNPGNGEFANPVNNKNKKGLIDAYTAFTTLVTNQIPIPFRNMETLEISRVSITPTTGRWHQLRQHFSFNKTDIIGDNHHGYRPLNKLIAKTTGIERLLLHANKIEFTHPNSGEQLTFECVEPPEFRNLMNYMK